MHYNLIEKISFFLTSEGGFHHDHKMKLALLSYVVFCYKVRPTLFTQYKFVHVILLWRKECLSLIWTNWNCNFLVAWYISDTLFEVSNYDKHQYSIMLQTFIWSSYVPSSNHLIYRVVTNPIMHGQIMCNGHYRTLCIQLQFCAKLELDISLCNRVGEQND